MRLLSRVKETRAVLAYNGAMFDLIDERKGPKLGIWTMAGLLFIVFFFGLGIGVLIERRSTDFLDWASVVFVGIGAWLLYCHPLLDQIDKRVKKNHGH